MANSGKLTPVDPEAIALQALRRRVAPGSHLLVGLSGGVDSVVLLTVLAAITREFPFSLCALHVNHGLSRNALDWAGFCSSLCSRLEVPLSVECVDVRQYRSLGLEAAARRARYEAYTRHAKGIVVLGQHRDDQAETLMLQLIRGAGVSGMAAMPEQRKLPGQDLIILRPFLSLARADIEAYARRCNIAWIEDESNNDVSLPRNFIRHRVLPILEERFSGVATTLSRSALHLADADELLRQLGREDASRCSVDASISVVALQRLGLPRTANVLRYLCWERNIRRPSSARLGELARQILEARTDSSPRHILDGWIFRRHSGHLVIERSGMSDALNGTESGCIWRGEEAIAVPQFNGVLRFQRVVGTGLKAARLKNVAMILRARRGGERFRPEAGRPRRTLKNLLQERKIPPWRRNQLLLIFCRETLICVPGIGEDCDWHAGPAEPGIVIRWDKTG